jgi:hypothetical protein
MIVPVYDEFCVYTTQEDIECYVKYLIENNFVENEDDLYSSCLKHFGFEFNKIIEYIVYDKD